MIDSKVMAKFVENSLENLGFVGFKFTGHHLTGRRDKGITTWFDNRKPITEEQAHRLIRTRFT